MDSQKLSGFMGILKESLKILHKSRKLMLSIASFSFLLNTILFLSNTFSTKPLITDLVLKATLLSIATPSSSDFLELLLGIRDDGLFLVGIVVFFSLASLFVSLISITATISVSAMTLCERNIDSKGLVSRVWKSWTRPLVTCFYTFLFAIGYFFFFLALSVLAVLIAYRPSAIRASSTAVGALALTLWLYLSVVPVMAIVVSVMEENCYGIEALGKAGKLVKGKRLHGFLLNLIWVMLLGIIEVPCFRMIGGERSSAARIIIGLIVTNFTYLISMLQCISFTVLYFDCKKSHGEEIELQGTLDMEYMKLANTPLVDGNMA